MKVYRAVWRDPMGRLISASAEGKALIIYRPGEWVEAPMWLQERGYHILAFRTKKDAKNYIPKWAVYEIWEAEAPQIIQDLPPELDKKALSKGFFIQSRNLGGWPRGTVMVPKIKLVKKVY